MSRLVLPLRRLRWQLTLSYILITLVAGLTLEIATTVSGVIAPPKTANASPADILINAMTFTEAPQLVPYLEQSPPDQHGLAVWAAIWAPGFTYSKLGFSAGLPAPAGSTSRIPAGSNGARAAAVVVVGLDGQVLASAPSSGAALIATPQAQTVLRTALQTPQPMFKVGTLSDGRTVAAVPIVARIKGPALGALLIAATIEPGPALPLLGPDTLEQIAVAFKNVLPTALALVVLASIVGTLFGVLASRGITRRLGRITLAAEAWSRAEFQTTVRDAGQDELGQLAQDLNSMAAQLQHLLAARQELAVVEERHRLARDLHDSVKQQLFVVTMLVGTARRLISGSPEAEQTLTEAEQLAGHAQQELTALIRALRPVELTDKELSVALRTLGEQWAQRTGIQTEVVLPDALPVSPPVQEALYRVAQEALNNVAQHSGATAVEVRVEAGPETLLLSIQDNGHGFDLARQADHGLGLRSMRERVEALGGTLLVYSAPAGTRIEARIPMERATFANGGEPGGDPGQALARRAEAG